MTNYQPPLDLELIRRHNAPRLAALEDEYGALSRSLAHRGIAIDAIKVRTAKLELATPSWGTGVGGTRFARFPLAGEPTNLDEKLEDCAIIQQLSRSTPRVSLHFPWDKVPDPRATRDRAQQLGIGFDAVNSNTFQDQSEQANSYRYGSLTHTSAAVRDYIQRNDTPTDHARGAVLYALTFTVKPVAAVVPLAVGLVLSLFIYACSRCAPAPPEPSAWRG